MDGPESAEDVLAEAEATARDLVSKIPDVCPRESKQKIVEQQEAFLGQIQTVRRVERVQKELERGEMSRAGAQGAGADGLSQEVEQQLLDVFSLKDTMDDEGTRLLAAQVGVSESAVRAFFEKQRESVQKLVEDARKEETSKKGEPGLPRLHINTNGAHLDGEDKDNSAQDNCTSPEAPTVDDAAATESVELQQRVVQDREATPPAADAQPGAKDSGVGRRTRRSTRSKSSHNKPAGTKGAARGRTKGRKSEKEVAEDQKMDEVDHRSLNKLRDLQDFTGAVVNNAAAGNLLLLMKLEDNYGNRAAQLDMVKKTTAKPVLERLVSPHLMDVLVKWIKEGEGKRQSTFLKSVVETIGHLPVPAQYRRASGLHAAISRLATKYANDAVKETASQLLKRWQDEKQASLSPRSLGLAPGLQRLASLESKQQGKVRMLVGPEARRPLQRKSSLSKYERPLTSSDILEKQERQKKLAEATGKSGAGGKSPGSTGGGTPTHVGSPFARGTTVFRTDSGQSLPPQTDLDDMPPEAWEALRAHREKKRLESERSASQRPSEMASGGWGQSPSSTQGMEGQTSAQGYGAPPLPVARPAAAVHGDRQAWPPQSVGTHSAEGPKPVHASMAWSRPGPMNSPVMPSHPSGELQAASPGATKLDMVNMGGAKNGEALNCEEPSTSVSGDYGFGGHSQAGRGNGGMAPMPVPEYHRDQRPRLSGSPGWRTPSWQAGGLNDGGAAGPGGQHGRR
eukprot:evm.model.scf_1717.1 EVM.evm.TU.scf_1717.1   scf_1717:7442-14124(+)